jgi:hypothetical protein
MTVADNILGLLGNVGNAMGIQGDNPQGFNALQRIAAADPSVQQSGTTNVQSNLAALAQNPQFQALAPADQIATIGRLTGDPKAIAQSTQMGALAKLNTGNPNVNTVMPFMQPNDAVNALANPMLQTGSSVPQPIPNPAPNGAGGWQPPPPVIYPGGLGPENADDKRNYNFLQSVPPVYRGIVKGISEGDEHAGMIARASPQSAYILNAAYQFDPTLTQPGAGPDARQKTNVEFSGGGKQGITRAAINTSIQHASQLAAATHDLNNTQSPMWNWAGNATNQNVLGTDAGSNFDAIADRLAPELAKVSSGTGAASEGETQKQREGFQKNGSPEQQYGALSNIMELVSNKSKELGNNYKQSMGRSIPMISVENQQHLADIQRLTALAKQGKQNGAEAIGIVSRLRQVESPPATPDATQTANAAPAQAKPPLTGVDPKEIAAELAARKKAKPQ